MEKIVFTNGCFDILHAGHVDLLERAAALGDRLVVGINDDQSIARIKGPGRPVNDAEARKAVLLSLRVVDEVVVFQGNTPEEVIRELSPDVLVKGGDWSPDQIIGADYVLARGGEVYSLPLKGNFSTTGIIDRFTAHLDAVSESKETSSVALDLQEHSEVIRNLSVACGQMIEESGRMIVGSLAGNGKLLLCGNGGSAADAQHIAAELVGRFEGERRALSAIALTTDTSALTAIGNDYGFDRVYSRQVEALAKQGDVLVCISTSGNSPNILAAAMAARAAGATTIALTGANGARIASICDLAVLVPSRRTARIQEAHITIGHIWCRMVEEALLQGV